jgi:hypothetical protein
MKAAIFLLALGLLGMSTATFAQHSVAEFYHKFKKQEDVKNFKLPGWLIWIGTGLVYNSIRDEETRTWLRLARKMGKIRLMQTENSSSILREDLSSFVGSIKSNNAYSDLIYVRDEDSDLNIMVREGSTGRLKELLIVGSNDGETIMLSAKTRLRMKDLNGVLQHYLQELHWKEKAKAKNLPRA